MTQSKLDEDFEKILNQMILLAIQTTGKCTQEILKVSESYLDQKAHKALEDFYNLYFSDNLADQKDQVNNEVDDLIAQAMDQKNAGNEISLSVSEEAEERRLGLSAVQKELEGLITLDQGMKEQFAPVLSSMQFEDAVRQRLEHINSAWSEIIKKNCSEDKVDFEIIKNSMSSIEETASYYRKVLKEEPPEQEEAPSSMLFF